MKAYVKRLYFLIVVLFGGLFPSAVLFAETIAENANLCGQLETLIQDPRVGMRLESHADGFVLRVQSQNSDSQKTVRAFAVEVLKEHDLLADIPKTNGYGLPEQ